MGASVRTVCSYCGVGCGMVLDVEGGRITGVRGDPEHPANRGRLCTKGATSAEALAAEGRLGTALRRGERGGPAEPVDVDAAVTETARRLRAILDEHGPDALAMYVSGQLTLEAQYLATKLAKGFWRTRWIESNSRLCMASAGTGYKQSLGSDGPPGSYADLDTADVFLVIGSNAADCHPILFLRMMDRVKAGATLIVVDPRRTATAAKADLFLQVAPGTDLALLNGLLHLVVAGGHVDEAFVAAHTEGWDAMPAFLADYDPATVAAITGIAEADLREAARLIGEAGAWTSLWTMGLNQSTHGTWNTNALVNLHLATGAICRPGAGPFSLTGQPNAMGGREMGYMGPGLPGQRAVVSAADRAFVEDLWDVPAGTIREDVGGGTIEMFSRMRAGEIKASWIMCTNPVASVPNRASVVAALQTAEFVVTQDVFAATETNAHADVVLPASTWAEVDGVMINSERNLTLLQRAVDAPGQALPDWQLIARVACEMGYADAFTYTCAEEVFEEIKGAANPATGYDLTGTSYDRLRETPVQWPAAPGGPSRNPIRYATPDGPRFATPSGKAQFFPRPHLPPAELPDDDFPFLLTTGRVQHQWHTLTKTGRVPRLNELNPGPFLEVHPDDAVRLGLGAGDTAAVVSRRGRAELPVVVTDRMRPGALFAPFHWADLFGDGIAVNAVTSDAVDPYSLQPELKACAVSLSLVRTAERAEPAPAFEITGDGRPLLVLWASQTGTAEGVATSLADTLTRSGLTPALARMDALVPGAIPAGADVLAVTSTFGDGDAPDVGARFWEALTTHRDPLDDVRFGVLALGDSTYSDFCGHGRKLDTRLAELGGARLLDRADCEPDFAATASGWADRVVTLLGGTPVTGGLSAPAAVDAELTESRLLGLAGSAKEVRRFTLAADGLAYEPGDALAVTPANQPALVAEWLALTGLDGDAAVLVDGAEVGLAHALTHLLDITRVSPALLRFVAERTGDRGLTDLLRAGHDTDLARWSWDRQAADVLHEHPVRAAAQDWVDVLGRLQPRRYSISSSPLTSPDRVSLTVSVVRFTSRYGRGRGGVCSTFLADGAGRAPVLVRPAPRFRPPSDPDTPTIMVGPGTGVAPFIGFLDHRRALGHRGHNWLFFGEQRRATDFYYRTELEAMHAEGTLDRLDTAFSRDQRRKVYVQHRMREHGAMLWRRLDEGAHVYVCGDASRMAKDVDAALRTVIAEHGRRDPDVHLEEMTAAGRYVRDVY